MAKRQQQPEREPERATAAPTRYRVLTKSDKFSGVRAGVVINNGLGFTSDAAAAQACRELGYEVEEVNA